MPLTTFRLASGNRCALTAEGQNLRHGDELTIVVCEEKSSIALSSGMAALFCCIAGESTISTSLDSKVLRRADIHVSDAHSAVEATVASRSACVVIAGLMQAWILNGRRLAPGRRSLAVPVPATYRKNTAACGNFLRLARQCLANNGTGADERRLHDLFGHVDLLQTEMTQCIARCPGSSVARKRAVFTRLHRAKNLIEACANDDLDISKLALAANYSIGHFITLFRLVFGETPYAAISRHRLANARSLLGGSDLAVGEIAQSSGFSSPSSFTRAMKKHTGQSATQFRLSQRNFAQATRC